MGTAFYESEKVIANSCLGKRPVGPSGDKLEKPVAKYDQSEGVIAKCDKLDGAVTKCDHKNEK